MLNSSIEKLELLLERVRRNKRASAAFTPSSERHTRDNMPAAQHAVTAHDQAAHNLDAELGRVAGHAPPGPIEARRSEPIAFAPRMDELAELDDDPQSAITTTPPSPLRDWAPVQTRRPEEQTPEASRRPSPSGDMPTVRVTVDTLAVETPREAPLGSNRAKAVVAPTTHVSSRHRARTSFREAIRASLSLRPR